MRVFLTNNENLVIGGFESVLYKDIDKISDGEAYVLYMDELLINSLHYESLSEEFYKILRKVAYDGSIIIQGIDINLLAKKIIWENISGEEMQHAIYISKNIIEWKDVKSALIEQNFSIKRVELNSYKFIIEASRND